MNNIYLNNYSYAVYTQSDLYKAYSSDQMDLKKAIEIVNNNPVLSAGVLGFLSIDMAGFEEKEDLLVRFKSMFQRKNKHSYNYTHFNAFNSQITIHKNDLLIDNNEPLEERRFFSTLKSILTPSECLNFVALHEIGHAVILNFFIKDKNYKVLSNLENADNIKKMINDISLYFDRIPLCDNHDITSIFRATDLNLMLNNSVHEGVAELYACIATSYLYPKDKAIEIVEAVIESREYADKVINEMYCTKQSMATFLNDFKNDRLNFTNFEQMYEYISDTVGQTFETLLTQYFSITPIYKDVVNPM